MITMLAKGKRSRDVDVIVTLTELRPDSVVHSTRLTEAWVSKTDILGRRETTINSTRNLTRRLKRGKCPWWLYVIEVSMLRSRAERGRTILGRTKRAGVVYGWRRSPIFIHLRWIHSTQRVLCIAACLTEPTWDCSKSHLRQHAFVWHFVSENTTLLCKVALPGANPMCAIYFSAKNSRRGRVVAHPARALGKVSLRFRGLVNISLSHLTFE